MQRFSAFWLTLALPLAFTPGAAQAAQLYPPDHHLTGSGTPPSELMPSSSFRSTPPSTSSDAPPPSASTPAPIAPASVSPPSTPSPSAPSTLRRHQRSSWYLGFGVGSGLGGFTERGHSTSFPSYLGGYSPQTLAYQLELGLTLRPDLLLGVDIHSLRTSGSHTMSLSARKADASVRATDVLALVTWFPHREGLFLRGGAGLAKLNREIVTYYYAYQDQTATGLALLGGIGYALWLGQHLNLTISADLSSQTFGYSEDLPSSARFFDLLAGLYWY